MSKKLFFYTLLPLLAVGAAVLPVSTSASPNSDTIPVQDADGVFEATLPEVDPSANPPLPSTYFPVRASDGTGWFNLMPVTGTLRTLLEGIPSGYHPVRASDWVSWVHLEPISGTLALLLEEIPDSYFPVRTSDGVSWVYLEPVPDDLASLIDEIPTYYFPVRASDGVVITTLQYPAQLLGDTTPPQIFNVSLNRLTGLIEWQTDEFADSQVWYGPEFGSCTFVVSDTLWVKDHQLILPGLTEDIQYFVIRSADRSGNTAEYYIPGYSISGHVKDQSDVPIPDVVISANPTQVTLTDDSGNYTLPGVLPGDHVITPYHPDYVFTPNSISVTLSGDVTGQDFVGTSYNAAFSASPTVGFAPLTVVFTNTSTGDYTASLWDFGDGATSTQISPTHIYNLPDVYTVTLTISRTGGTDTLTRTNYITVYEPVEAGFVANPRSGAPPLTVQFTDTSSGPVDEWEWTFGDGQMSALRHPAHTYATAGAYTVTLTVQAAGDSALWSGGTDTLVRTRHIIVHHQLYLPLALRQ